MSTSFASHLLHLCPGSSLEGYGTGDQRGLGEHGGLGGPEDLGEQRSDMQEGPNFLKIY